MTLLLNLPDVVVPSLYSHISLSLTPREKRYCMHALISGSFDLIFSAIETKPRGSDIFSSISGAAIFSISLSFKNLDLYSLERSGETYSKSILEIFFPFIPQTQQWHPQVSKFIENFLFELNIDAYALENGLDGKPYKNCWHLDKHILSTAPKYTHPTYHFHFGGNYLNGLDTGEISIFSFPRLPHPPMDIFLGFHFIISNFYSSKEYSFVNELKGNEDYKSIIKRAQERLWKPYFKAFDLTNTHDDFTINKIFPLYLS